MFGGSGQCWLALYRDDGSGRPGEYIGTSALADVAAIPKTTGYNWVDFLFREQPILQPGRYWLAFGFAGSPVINWFFSYGKPVGPVYGTRYKTILDTQWSNSLAFEFNYRVLGYVTQ